MGGLERRSRIVSPKEKEIVADHEAGHALVPESREQADKASKISIIPRGVAVLGSCSSGPGRLLEAAHLRVQMTLKEKRNLLDVLAKESTAPLPSRAAWSAAPLTRLARSAPPKPGVRAAMSESPDPEPA